MKNLEKNKFVLVIMILILISCKTETVSEYMAKIFSDKKAYVFKTDDYLVKIWKVPVKASELMATSCTSNQLLNNQLLDSLDALYPGIKNRKGQYFMLSFESKDTSTTGGVLPGLRKDPEIQVNPEHNYMDQIHYFLYGMKKDIWFECDGKEFPTEFYVYNKNYGLLPNRTIEFGSEKISENCTMVLNNVFAGLGRIKIKISEIGD